MDKFHVFHKHFPTHAEFVANRATTWVWSAHHALVLERINLIFKLYFLKNRMNKLTQKLLQL